MKQFLEQHPDQSLYVSADIVDLVKLEEIINYVVYSLDKDFILIDELQHIKE